MQIASQRDAMDSAIHESARGFLFLGTPHHGSRLTAAATISAMLSHWEGSSISLLLTIKPGSPENESLHDWFITSYPLEDMVCVFETVQESVFGIPVTYVSTPCHNYQKSLSTPNILADSREAVGKDCWSTAVWLRC